MTSIDRSSRRILPAAILSAVLSLPLEAKVIRLGIMAGHNVGYQDDPGLKYAEDDAVKMAHLFKEVGGMDENDVMLLKAPRPEQMDLAFDLLSKRASEAAPDDEVIFLFYYSGHGTKDYLKLGRHPYPLAQLKDRIDKVPAKLRIGILDACQSGAITRIKGARLVQPFLVGQSLKSAGSILIASSSEDENSQESEQLRGSFFTHHWHTALRGAGDASGDRRVSLLEAYQYAYNKTLVHTKDTQGGAQHPNAQFKLDTEGDVILTDLNNGMGGLKFDRDLDGEILVANVRAEVMAEIRKEPGSESFLALPPGKYRVFQRIGRKTRQGRITIAGAETREVRDRDLSAGFLQGGTAKGRGSEEDVELPWKVEDWSSQAPLELGIGQVYTNSYDSWMVRAGYKFYPRLAGSVSYIIHKEYSRYSLFSPDFFNHDIRLGLQFSKLLSPNLEFLATPFYRMNIHSNSPYPELICEDGYTRCSERPTRSGTEFDPAAGLGAHGAVRLWLMSRLSVQIQYGLEYDLNELDFDKDALTVLPSFHF